MITSPLKILYNTTKTGKEHFLTLSLNQYRNTQYFVLNKAKQCYKDLMWDQVSKLPTYTKVRIIYTVFVGSSHKSDVMNWVSVVDKFFQDVLVEAGKLPDDNYDYVPEVVAQFGGIDKANPRVEIQIETLSS